MAVIASDFDRPQKVLLQTNSQKNGAARGNWIAAKNARFFAVGKSKSRFAHTVNPSEMLDSRSRYNSREAQ